MALPGPKCGRRIAEERKYILMLILRFLYLFPWYGDTEHSHEGDQEDHKPGSPVWPGVNLIIPSMYVRDIS